MRRLARGTVVSLVTARRPASLACPRAYFELMMPSPSAFRSCAAQEPCGVCSPDRGTASGEA